MENAIKKKYKIKMVTFWGGGTMSFTLPGNACGPPSPTGGAGRRGWGLGILGFPPEPAAPTTQAWVSGGRRDQTRHFDVFGLDWVYLGDQPPPYHPPPTKKQNKHNKQINKNTIYFTNWKKKTIWLHAWTGEWNKIKPQKRKSHRDGALKWAVKESETPPASLLRARS